MPAAKRMPQCRANACWRARTLPRVLPGAAPGIDMLRVSADRGANDARWLRERQGRERLLAEVSRQASDRFRGERV